ncbi:DNA-binding response regulator [Nocardioides mangrovicus]|uniref:DNA-binding response regulator n=1 Tax=Nocardioides mangrovicus TaxID=2478913 RepID=A0A3L8P390_9ACTN|nr:LuxR C-terminal-related transcriptional regulator [Nocardioides mangrovicus]RLV49059.1 DNA-binding response regulator [Nocardioides mangrovicus]
MPHLLECFPVTYLADLSRYRAPASDVSRADVEPTLEDAHRADWPGRDLGLTRREADVLRLIAHALSNIEIANRLHIAVNTVKTAIRNGYAKLGLHTRSEAIVWAIENGFRPDLHEPQRPPRRHARFEGMQP